MRRTPSALRTVATTAVLLSALAAPGATRVLAADSAPKPPPDPPAQVVRKIATACNDKHYSDVGDFLHSWLRRIWIDIDYRVKDYCEVITKTYTLKDVQIDKEEFVGDYAVVSVTYLYQDGSETIDRATLLLEKGAWKLSN
jgi:hypothetical protein